jgi:hypothetical protein
MLASHVAALVAVQLWCVALNTHSGGPPVADRIPTTRAIPCCVLRLRRQGACRRGLPLAVKVLRSLGALDATQRLVLVLWPARVPSALNRTLPVPEASGEPHALGASAAVPDTVLLLQNLQ